MPKIRLEQGPPISLGYRFTVSWGNNYKPVPAGMDRVQLVVDSRSKSSRDVPPEIEMRYQELGGPGCGWFIGISAITPAPRPWSLKRKQSYRRGRLRARVERKAPLFAEEIISREMAKNPNYFGVTSE